MDLETTRAIVPGCCAFLGTGMKTVWGVIVTPFGELGLMMYDIVHISYCFNISNVLSSHAAYRVSYRYLYEYNIIASSHN